MCSVIQILNRKKKRIEFVRINKLRYCYGAKFVGDVKKRLNKPGRMAANQIRSLVFIADYHNDRIVLLDSKLKPINEYIIIKREQSPHEFVSMKVVRDSSLLQMTKSLMCLFFKQVSRDLLCMHLNTCSSFVRTKRTMTLQNDVTLFYANQLEY